MIPTDCYAHGALPIRKTFEIRPSWPAFSCFRTWYHEIVENCKWKEWSYIIFLKKSMTKFSIGVIIYADSNDVRQKRAKKLKSLS